MTKLIPENTFLVHSLKKNDQKVFKKIYSDYFEKLCRYLLSYTQNKELIEDVVQDTFIKLWVNRKKLTINTSLKSYLYKSVTNNFIENYRQKKKRDVFLESYYRQALTKFTEKDIEYKENRLKQLEACISNLPEKCKLIFMATKFSELKYKEAAESFKISIKTVEGHISKAYSLIKICMA